MQELDIVLLLHKRLTGEITSTESTALDVWLGQSAENARIAEQYTKVWAEASQQRKANFDLDMDAEFARLLSRLGTREQQPSGRVAFIGRWWFRAAAAVVFLLVATLGYREFALPAPGIVLENKQARGNKLAILPDGSKVWLRQNTSIEYPRTFTTDERRVHLKGEAYFEVAHNAGQPFRVELEQGGLVEVLGTRFNIRSAAGAEESCVLVREGKVRYTPTYKSKGTVLTANRRAVFNRKNARLHLTEAFTLNELAWQTGQLQFDSTPLRYVLPDLEKHYAVTIELQNQAMKACSYTALLKDQSLEDVLESFSLIYKFNVSNPSPGQYLLSGGVCK